MAKKDAPLKITVQMVGMKNLKITGGWRLEFDLFESKLVDILSVTALVNEQKTVEITIRPLE